MTRRIRICFVSLAFVLALGGCNSHRRTTTLTLSLAASLKNAMSEIEASYIQQHPEIRLENNFGSSGTLTQQIEQGSPVDLFLSAAAKPMDDIEQQGLLEPGTRENLLRNRLVLIASSDSQISNFAELTSPKVRVVALGDPGSVPAGQYGQQSLAALHLFDQIKPKLELGKDVRQVLRDTGPYNCNYYGFKCVPHRVCGVEFVLRGAICNYDCEGFREALRARQDQETMIQQANGLKYDPSLMLTDDADRPAKRYFALKQARLDSLKTGEPMRHPMEGPVTLRWRS